MNKKRLHYLEQTLITLQSAYNDLTVIRDEEEHDFENIPDNKSNSELAEQTVKNYQKATEDIKSTVSIAEVIGSCVSLKRSGANFMACCPFHKEKTPSFSVNESKGFFHCFGCGESGDVIKFVEKYYNLDYPAAVEKLAAQYGITIEETRSREDSKNDEYYEANRIAARWFFEKLSTTANPGYTYMSKRGITPKTMQYFGIGYNPEGWTGLTDHLKANGVSRETMLALGLCAESNGRIYDKFHGRVIFPIINVRGKVIGFGARILTADKDKPKYMNSNESSIYQKKLNLYGINRSKDAIVREDCAIVVEGYMDCISLFQSGVQNVVASCGTAFTPEQAKLLRRYAKKVILCLDSDPAGINAAIRGIDILRAAQLEVRVLNVDDGKDPDEYVQKNGKDAFLKLLEENTVADIDYKVSVLKKSFDLKDHTQGIKFFKALAQILHGLDPVEADIYIQKYSKEYLISEGALRREAEQSTSDAPQDTYVGRQQSEQEKTKSELSAADVNLERMLIRLIMLKSSYYEELRDYPEAFVTAKGKVIAAAFGALYVPGEEFDRKKIESEISEEAAELLSRILENIQIGEADKAFDDCISKLEAKRKDKRRAEIYTILEMSDSMPEDAVDQTLIKQLLTELKTLQK